MPNNAQHLLSSVYYTLQYPCTPACRMSTMYKRSTTILLTTTIYQTPLVLYFIADPLHRIDLEAWVVMWLGYWIKK
jgi:hypothetical protein